MSSYDETVQTYDLAYVRATGEEIQARLFPQPKRLNKPDGTTETGPRPASRSVALTFTPDPDTSLRLLFIAIRSIQQLLDVAHPDAPPVFASGYDGQDANPGAVLVIDEDDMAFYIRDLTLGKDQSPPLMNANRAWRSEAALTALFRAVAGVEVFDDPGAVRRQPVEDPFVS